MSINQAEIDTAAFRTGDSELCMLCRAKGPDHRDLYLECLYVVKEIVPEMLSTRLLTLEDGYFNRGYYARICKGCRGRLLDHLGQWRNECVALRGMPKDEDGVQLPPSPEHNIPVRHNGRIVWLTREEWDKAEKLKDA